MGDYTSNFAALLTGNLGISVGDTKGGGGGVDASSDTLHPQGRTPMNDSVHIRDILNHIVAGGYTDFSNEDVRANYNYLKNLIGVSKAEKLFVQAFSFNQKPGNNKKGGEEKIQSFYDIGSSDPETNKQMVAIKNLGSIKEGFRTSVNEGVKLLNGTDKKEDSYKSQNESTSMLRDINKKTGQ
jgi:hypothetical protein